MRDFLDKCEQMDPTIFAGIEGNECAELGEDKRSLIEWGLTEEAANRLRSNVSDAAWSQRVLNLGYLIGFIIYGMRQLS